MYKWLTLYLIIFLPHTWACEIILPSHLLVINSRTNSKEYIQQKNCTVQTLNIIHQNMITLEGRLASYQLEEIFKSKNADVMVNTSSIQIQQISTLLRAQLSIPSHSKLLSIDSHSKDYMTLLNGDRVEVSCSNCSLKGSVPLNITISHFDGTTSSISATSQWQHLVKAYRVLVNIPSFSSLTDMDILKEEYVPEIPHTALVKELDELKYYKTNKLIKAGELLRLSDLNAVNIVKAGLKTDVILENTLVRIKTQGISRGNGVLGEMVEVYHPQKNKNYQGKVIDINKVLVEL